MSSFRDEVGALLFGYVRVWEGKNGRWAVGLEPQTLVDRIQPMPPGQQFHLGACVEICSELDYLDGPEYAEERRKAYKDGLYRTLWAGRPIFETRESAVRMIFGWIRRERPELLQWCVREAMEGRAWRAARRNAQEVKTALA